MKNMKNILSTIAVLFVLLALSCNKSSTLGSDLFTGEKLNVDFTDSLKINALSEAFDSTQVTSSTGVGLVDSLLVGDLADPVMGRTEARIYCQFTNQTDSVPDFTKIDADSILIVLGYSYTRVYGDTTKPFNIGVYRVTDAMPTTTVYSNKRLATQALALKKQIFFPQPTTKIVDYVKYKTATTPQRDTTDTLTLSPRVRINLGATLLSEISKWDTMRLKNFKNELKGLEIRAESTTDAMLNFNLSPNSIAGIYLYYHDKGDNTRKQKAYKFPLTASRFNNFKHGYSSGIAGAYINTPAKNDRLFMQGMAGPNIKLEFPNIKNLGKAVVNKAEIEFTVVNDDKSNLLPAIDQAIARTAQLGAIDDLFLDDAFRSGADGRNGNKMTISGGFPRTETVNGETVKKYYFNVSAQLQGILDGKKGNSLYIVPHYKEEKGSRVMFYGTTAPKYRAKLNVYYTKL
jgi:hypothetical protein